MHADTPSPTSMTQPLTPELQFTNTMFEDFWNPNWVPSPPQTQPLQTNLFSPTPGSQPCLSTKCNASEYLGAYYVSPPISPPQHFPTAPNTCYEAHCQNAQCSATTVPTSRNHPPNSTALVTMALPQIQLNIPMPTLLDRSFSREDSPASAEGDETESKGSKKRKNNAKQSSSAKTRKKTTRACVYCQRSHSCCDSFRPCSKCLARGIGHLCRDSEPKKMKKKKFLYLLEDNNVPPVVNPTSSTLVMASNVEPHCDNYTKQNPILEKYVTLAELTQDFPASEESKNPIVKLTADLPFTSRKGKRPFPRDIRLSFHRLGRRCGWSSELIMMWNKVEEFWKWRDDDETMTEQQRAKEVAVASSFRREVISRATSIMQLLNDMAEPMIIWSEGMRIYAVNKAAQAFFGRSSEEMTNAKFGYEDDIEDENIAWSPDAEAEESDSVFRLFDLIHKDDATVFGCSAASDAMSLYPLDLYNGGDAARGFRMKVRVNLTKRQANNANVVPTVNIVPQSPPNSNASDYVAQARSTASPDDGESVVCVVTQSHFRDTKGRFLFASCTFVRLDDL